MTLVLLGAVIGLGVRRAAVTDASRERLAQTLRAQIRERTTELAATRSRVGELRGQVAASRGERRRAAAERARADADVAALGPAGGWLAVRGPGVRITLVNRLGGGSGPADPRAGAPRGVAAGGLVQDHDLADLVNVLWIAGAEAITVNGVRLTALSAIRSAGDVVLVDFVPVLSPYTVEAVGDATTLAGRTEQSAVVDRLRHRPGSPVTSLTVATAADLTLPAAPAPVLRNVRRSGS
ncbi:conserved hypothetical protein [Frankia canadensis]|uniref:DUF881 domain-containing protein n=2 Tax=Frankia canadensis TaxID=1836972 RepID=A0A2I2KIS3_9ACTN|nr:conserved hypothetical protein [Frankia canadensis]SOU52844.1 conserved hypothetical protein [Frankia canadensis]